MLPLAEYYPRMKHIVAVRFLVPYSGCAPGLNIYHNHSKTPVSYFTMMVEVVLESSKFSKTAKVFFLRKRSTARKMPRLKCPCEPRGALTYNRANKARQRKGSRCLLSPPSLSLSLSLIFISSSVCFQDLNTCHRVCVMVYAVFSIPIRGIRVVQELRSAKINR